MFERFVIHPLSDLRIFPGSNSWNNFDLFEAHGGELSFLCVDLSKLISPYPRRKILRLLFNPVRKISFHFEKKENIFCSCFLMFFLLRRFLAENVLVWRNLLVHSGFMLLRLIDSVAFVEVLSVLAALLAVAVVFVGLTKALDDPKQVEGWLPRGEHEFFAAQIGR